MQRRILRAVVPAAVLLGSVVAAGAATAGAATSPRSLDERDHISQRADSHLIQAKRDGRDRVICDAV